MPDFGRWTSNGGDSSLNDINRADRFVEALSTNQPVYSTDPGDAELAYLLADWRDGVRETPLFAVVTEDDAAMALRSAQRPRHANRFTLSIVGSAAAAVLCIGGFGAAVYGAGPGDALYGMRDMIFGEQQVTRDDQVALAAQQELAQVQQLVEDGQWDQAQDKLVALSTTVQSVDEVERKHDLIEQFNALSYKVVEQDPAATLPPAGEPLPVLPESPLTLLPVPVVTDTTSTTDITTSVSDVPGATTTSPSPSDTSTTPSSGEPTSTPTTPIPTPTTPIPTPTAPIPTPTTPIPTPTSAIPTPSTTVAAPPPATTVVPTTVTTTVPTTVTTTTTRQPVADAPSPQAPVSQAPASPTRVATSSIPPAPRTTVPPVPEDEVEVEVEEGAEVPVTTTIVMPESAG
ncbi:anti-sigma-D factor RsdA [Mycolicibacterium sp. GCM10028919]|uniref:anti-sigma-D factor RsdA n=1 Tax=Mycolicibacterium sp. GCM10028919 TaxID=3273401 RepID=UPI003622C375